MSFFIVPENTRTELNRYNRHRRNQKRKLSRQWRGKLRRLDERAYRNSHALFIESCAKECICQPPYPCPCDSVLCGMWCEQRGAEFEEFEEFDEEDEVEL